MPAGTRQPRVLNRHSATLRDLDQAVYVGRPSKWGNPFHVNRSRTQQARWRVATREEAIEGHRTWLLQGEGRVLLTDLHELRGRDLSCWCAPRPCHADLLLKLANSVDTLSTVCEDVCTMPRKKAAVADAPTPPQSLEEQLESADYPTEDDSITSRVVKTGMLVLSCDESGVDVPKAVRQSVPTPAEIVREYQRLKQQENEGKKSADLLRDYVLAYLDRLSGDGSDDYKGDGGVLLRRVPGCSAETVDQSLLMTYLVERGIDPDVVTAAIDHATKPGTPYFRLNVIVPKEAK